MPRDVTAIWTVVGGRSSRSAVTHSRGGREDFTKLVRPTRQRVTLSLRRAKAASPEPKAPKSFDPVDGRDGGRWTGGAALLREWQLLGANHMAFTLQV